MGASEEAARKRVDRALEKLRQDPSEPIMEFTVYKSIPSLRYATPLMMKQECVKCHNTHPGSPKKDWQVGDVRGVVEIIRPLDRDAARTRGRTGPRGGPCWYQSQ